jgi:hypothetical protein
MKLKRDSHVSNIVSIPKKARQHCTDQREKEIIGTKEIRFKNPIMVSYQKKNWYFNRNLIKGLFFINP